MTANNVYSLKSLDTNIRGIVREAISINGFSCISHHEGFGTTPSQKNVFVDQFCFPHVLPLGFRDSVCG